MFRPTKAFSASQYGLKYHARRMLSRTSTPANASTARSTFMSVSPFLKQFRDLWSVLAALSGCRGKLRAHPGNDPPRIHRSCGPRQDAPASEQEQGRNARDAQLRGDARFLIGVELDEPDIRFELACRLLEHRSHDPAGATPGRPDVEQDRNIVVPTMLLEGRGVDRRRMTIEQRLVTGTAPPLAHRPIGRDAIG